ncbi:MAG TPA: VOC family protein [Gammaproteobacteria bacterium]
MIVVENVIAWSGVERSADPRRLSGDIDIVANDLCRAVRFYSRVFGLLPGPRSWGESLVVIPVTGDARLVIHDAQATLRRRARCTRRWGFVVSDLDHVRGLVWELGVKVARDSGAPDHVYRWSNGRSLYVQAPDGHEIELVEMPSAAVEALPRRAAAS